MAWRSRVWIQLLVCLALLQRGLLGTGSLAGCSLTRDDERGAPEDFARILSDSYKK